MSQELLTWSALSGGEFGTLDPRARERQCLFLLARLEEAGLQTRIRRHEAGTVVCDERELSGVLLLVTRGF